MVKFIIGDKAKENKPEECYYVYLELHNNGEVYLMAKETTTGFCQTIVRIYHSKGISLPDNMIGFNYVGKI